MKHLRYSLLCFLFLWVNGVLTAQTDTLRVMGYNVLYYGNGCQGPNYLYHGYLKTIIGFANADLVSLEKMASVPQSADDKYATAPAGFADSIISYAFNAAYPGRYAYCPFTNGAKSNNQATLFYDQRKLGFLGIVSSYVNITDFNTYKLYYKDADLATTHDTTFLYLTLNHDKSGDDNVSVRGGQIEEEMKHISEHFKRLPNMINIGDFNLRNSKEPCYQTLVSPDDTGFRFYDPPFYPDHHLKYPADWDHDVSFAAYFTTSTRESDVVPNNCGSGGGGKNWYDHIFLSSWIVNNTNCIRYIPNSYCTVGNDGKRFKISINGTNGGANTSAPQEVIDALYHMSNKYPVMVSLEVTRARGRNRQPDPEIKGAPVFVREEVTVDNPVGDELVMHFPATLKGQEITAECFDKEGRSQMKEKINVKREVISLRCKLVPGRYTIKFYTKHNIVSETEVNKS